MNKPLPKDAALRVARWCWPEGQWRDGANGDVSRYFDGGWRRWFAPLSSAPAPSVFADAERILLERGLESEYGHALAIELQYDSRDSDPGMFMIEATEDDFTKIATAPLDARIRAMLAVIDKLESAKK